MDIAFVESNKTGSGYEAIAAAKAKGLGVTFITKNLDYYLRPGALPFPGESVSQVVTCDTDDADAIAAAVRQLAVPPVALVAVGEWHLVAAAQANAKLGLRGPDPRAVMAGRDKYLARRLCERAGVPVPGYACLTAPEPLPDVRPPCVVKPVDDSMSHGVRLCHSAAEVREHARRLLSDTHNIRGQRKAPMVLVEEYLDGQEVSVEAFVFAGRTTVVAITRKLLTDPPVFFELGHVVPMELGGDVAVACELMVRSVVDAIGYDFGAVHAELRLTPNGPRLVEINCRLAGDQITRLVLLATGVDMAGVLIDLYRGIAPPFPPANRRGAAIVFLPSAPGSVEDVTGVAEAWAMPGVVEAAVYVAKGDKLSRKDSNVDRIGHVIAIGADGSSALGNAQAAARSVHVDIDEPAR
jgi:S-sulfo-L-cysteine synthase (3-phospho-L-serine-dependent)